MISRLNPSNIRGRKERGEVERGSGGKRAKKAAGSG